MTLRPVPFSATRGDYQQQAATLLAAHAAADPAAIRLFHEKHPRFLDEKVTWLPKPILDSEIQNAELTIADAQLAVARWYDFRDWAALSRYVEEVSDPNGPVHRFEAAVEAVVIGDALALTALLKANPDLIHARSTRITHFDPPVHRCTLLHYIGANGVEGHRQKTLKTRSKSQRSYSPPAPIPTPLPASTAANAPP